MARPLEFKRRVQLSERDLDHSPPRPRKRATPLVLGVLAYGCAFALAWGVSTNRLPITDTFTRILTPPAEAKTKRVAAVEPRIELQASLPAQAPALVAAAPEPSEPATVAEEPTATEPAAEPPAVARATAPATTEEPAPSQAPSSKTPESSKETLPPPAVPKPEPPPPAEPKQVASGGSCEAAIASYVEDANRKAPKDLGASDFGRVLNKGDYLDRCGVPTTTAVDICVAVQNGRSVGVTVNTSPSNSKLDRCLSRVLRGVSFPSHPRMDVVRTRFAD